MIAASAPLWPTWEMVWLIAASYLALALVYLCLVLWERRVAARERRHARMVARVTSHYAPGFGADREERQ